MPNMTRRPTLYREMERAGFDSISALSEETGIDASGLSAIFRGRRLVGQRGNLGRASEADRLAGALNITSDRVVAMSQRVVNERDEG